ncbi:YrhB domain-containing protein [Streptomyces sp. NPDC051956]|uniref:YrhB domain-containing protein n=1 Tax=Streptomyces sp. NPDC051956 TaxID=3365677 RepID=UPI0037D2D3BB
MKREAAVQAVEEQLERDCQQWRATGVDAMRMAVAHVAEHELVWIVTWDSEEFVRTRNSEFMPLALGRTWSTESTGDCTRSASSPRQPEGRRPTTEPGYESMQPRRQGRRRPSSSCT